MGVGTASAVLLTASRNWGPLQTQSDHFWSSIIPLIDFSERRAIREKVGIQIFHLLSQYSGQKSGPLNPKADDSVEWKRTQRKDILLIICIFQLSDLQEKIFGLSLRQHLHCMTFSLLFCFFKGHITITNYLLNYFPGLDIEKRNAFGFTALMKSAMQGRTECVKALMMAGMQSTFLPLCHHLTTTKNKIVAWDVFALRTVVPPSLEMGAAFK